MSFPRKRRGGPLSAPRHYLPEEKEFKISDRDHQIPGRYPRWLEDKIEHDSPPQRRPPFLNEHDFPPLLPPPFPPHKGEVESPPIIEQFDYQHGKTRPDFKAPNLLFKKPLPFEDGPPPFPEHLHEHSPEHSFPGGPPQRETFSFRRSPPTRGRPPFSHRGHPPGPFHGFPPTRDRGRPSPFINEEVLGQRLAMRGRGRGRGHHQRSRPNHSFGSREQRPPFAPVSFETEEQEQKKDIDVNYNDFSAPPLEEEELPNVERKGSSLYCELCDVSLSSIEQYQIHLVGSKHQKTLRKKGLADELGTLTKAAQEVNKVVHGETTPTNNTKHVFCKVCRQSCPHDQLGPHIASKVHTVAEAEWRFRGRRIPPFKELFTDQELSQQSEEERKKEEEREKKEEENKSGDTPLHCKVCNVYASTYYDFQQHIKGKRHLRAIARVRSVEEKGPFYCEVCSVTTTSKEALDQHFKGRSHAWNVLTKEMEGTEGDRFTCHICELSFVSEKELTAHFTHPVHVNNVKKRSGIIDPPNPINNVPVTTTPTLNTPTINKPSSIPALISPTRNTPSLISSTQSNTYTKVPPPVTMVTTTLPTRPHPPLLPTTTSNVQSFTNWTQTTPTATTPTTTSSATTNVQYPWTQTSQAPYQWTNTANTVRPQYPWNQPNTASQTQYQSQYQPLTQISTANQVQYPQTSTTVQYPWSAGQAHSRYQWTQTYSTASTTTAVPNAIQYPWMTSTQPQYYAATSTPSSQPYNPWAAAYGTNNNIPVAYGNTNSTAVAYGGTNTSGAPVPYGTNNSAYGYGYGTNPTGVAATGIAYPTVTQPTWTQTYVPSYTSRSQ